LASLEVRFASFARSCTCSNCADITLDGSEAADRSIDSTLSSSALNSSVFSSAIAAPSPVASQIVSPHVQIQPQPAAPSPAAADSALERSLRELREQLEQKDSVINGLTQKIGELRGDSDLRRRSAPEPTRVTLPPPTPRQQRGFSTLVVLLLVLIALALGVLIGYSLK
jgi:hypothetical protein